MKHVANEYALTNIGFDTAESQPSNFFQKRMAAEFAGNIYFLLRQCMFRGEVPLLGFPPNARGQLSVDSRAEDETGGAARVLLGALALASI